MKNLQVAQSVTATCAEGPGARFALWLQGCPLRCVGCCNPEMLAFQGGQTIPIGEVEEQIRDAQQQFNIEGITLLGGEPFSQADAAADLARFSQSLNLSVMVFTGHLLEDLRDSTASAGIERLLANTDILVDGPYDRRCPDSTRRWIGSTNQRIHFLTDHYCINDACWSESDTLELRLENGAFTVNGFPAPAASGIWKRPRTG